MAKIPGLNISAPVVPLVDTDTYPSHRAMYGQGGWQEVTTIADRDAITTPRREAGMAVYVTSEQRVFILNADLTTWTELKTKSLDSVRKTDTFTNFLPVEEDEIVQYVGATTENYTNGYFYTAVSNGEEPPTYTWTQINVQPVTHLVWGNIEGDITDQEDLNNELTSLQNQIDSLSGRGRYLSNWNCKTGIPATQPAIEDGEYYEYKSGDYFIVSDSFYPESGPESIVITQIYGESLSDLEVNLNIWKENNPDIDIIQDIVYTDVEITQTQTVEGDTSVLSIGNPTLFNQRYNEIEQSCRDEASQQGLTFISFDGLNIEWYKESHSHGGVNYTICLRVMGKYTANNGTTETTYVLDEGENSRIRANTADEAKSELLSQYGLKLDGNLVFNEPYRPHSVYITKSNEVVGGRWTYLGQPVEDNNIEAAFGVTYTGTPVINDVIRLDHKSSTLNFKPNGLSYLKTTPPTPSETIETEIVKENDTYLFDGSVWILLSNTAKEVNFETLEGSPYDNEALAEALDSKLDKVDSASIVYGTDENGDQTTYDITAFGQIDNVAVHGVDQTITDKRVDLSVVEQLDSLPVASEELFGRVVQYTGATTEDYTHGYFYECVSDGEDPATYSWQQISVQQGGSGGIAEGVVNHNSAQLIVNPIYDWVGTLAQYTDQNVEILHPEWVCFITDDGSVTGGGSSGGSFVPENVGVEGDVLTRTSTGYAWAEGGSGKTEDENGNLYITDKFAVNSDDEQYPLIYRTKSVDDSNTIKINAPVEIIDNDGSPRSLRVSGTLTAKDTKVKSLTIDGTVRAHGNIWMGSTSLNPVEVFCLYCVNGETFRAAGKEGDLYTWIGDWGDFCYTANEYPNPDENLYYDTDLTNICTYVDNTWTDNVREWDSSKASIKEVNSIDFHDDSAGIIDNVQKINGRNWKINGNGTVELKDAKGDGWKIVGGSIEGKKIRLSSGGNEMGSLSVNGAIKVYGEATVTGTSHIRGDIKLDPKDNGNGYARIYPTENETSSLGTPNHRFEKIYVKDIDISGKGGVDLAHLDGVEEINENTLQFTKLADLAEGYYNADGQYVGDTVSQYINGVDDLPMSIIAFVGANDITYKYGARVNDITAWHDEVHDTYVYTNEDNVSVGAVVYSDKAMTTLTTVKSVIREPNYTAINGGWSYDGEVVDVAEIGVEPGLGKLIKISDPGNRLLSNDLVYEYISNGNGQWGSYYMYQAKSSTANDWSDGVERKWLWFNGRITPGVGTQVYAVCNGMSDPTENALDLSTYKPFVSQILQQDVQYIKGLTAQGGSNPGDLKLITFNSGGQIGSIWHGQYWNGSQLVDTYAWTTSWKNPRIGDTIYKAIYNGGGSQITSEVIGTVTEIYRPDNSVAIDADTGDATKAHNYSQKHFNFYKASLETVPNGDSIPVMEYGGFYGSDWTPYPPIAANWYSQRILIYPDSNPEGSHIDFNSSTLAAGQSIEIYNESYFKRILQVQPNTDYIIITKSDSVGTDIKIDLYYSDGTLASSVENNLTSEGKCVYYGFQFTGVTTVDANTFVKIDYQATASTVKYTLNANDPTPTYQTARLIDKSNLVWAFYADSYNTISNDCMFSLAGGTVNIPGSIIFAPYRFYINSVVRTGDFSTIKKRNPEVGDALYYYRGNAPIDIPYYNDENRPVVKARTVVKTYRWKQVSGATTNYCYTFSRNPQLNSYSWAHDKLGGIYSPLESSDIVSSIVPLSVSGIYYLKSTSQYVYYNGSYFQECFYHKEVQDNVYSDIKLNSFYYWRALDGSYTFLDGKEHEVVATKSDLPRPDVITISETGQESAFFIRSSEDDTGNAIAWKKYEDTLIRYTDDSIFVNHVGDIVYANSSLSAESGTILNIAYQNEVIKVNRRDFELDLGNSSANSYYCWTSSDTGEQIYTRTPNPEVDDITYWDIAFESEAGTITEIVSGEPKAGTFYEVEQIPTDESGRYFWNGNTFVEAEKLYKSITIYGEDNDLGKVRTPWNNVYARSIESPYGTITTKEGHLEVNGGKITNVTTINYNGVNYIYTSVNVVNRLAIEDSNDMVRCEPVELGRNYCKWQSEANPETIYYTPSTDVNEEDTLYLDKECTESSGFVINAVLRTPTQVFTWTSTSGNIVYSLIRQLLEEDEIYANDLCIREVNPMLITSSQYTDIFQESIIMNNDSITLVLRDVNGNVTASCMLNATKLNKLEQLLSSMQ